MTQQGAVKATQNTVAVFTCLGLQINTQKSMFTSVQRLEFIGAYLDYPEATALLPWHRFMTLLNLSSTTPNSPQTSARICLQLLGHMPNNVREICQSHSRPAGLTPDSVCSTQTQPKQTSHDANQSKKTLYICGPNQMMAAQNPPTIIINTDASSLGWGAHLRNRTVQGCWSHWNSFYI